MYTASFCLSVSPSLHLFVCAPIRLSVFLSFRDVLSMTNTSLTFAGYSLYDSFQKFYKKMWVLWRLALWQPYIRQGRKTISTRISWSILVKFDVIGYMHVMRRRSSEFPDNWWNKHCILPLFSIFFSDLDKIRLRRSSQKFIHSYFHISILSVTGLCENRVVKALGHKLRLSPHLLSDLGES